MRVGERLGQHRADDVAGQRRGELVHVHLVVLGREHDRIHAAGAAVHIFHGHLALAVGPQEGSRPLFAHGGELPRERVRERDGQRQQLRRFVARKAEHHALVARAGAEAVGRFAAARLERAVHAARDIGRLRLKRDVDAQRVRRKTVFRRV